MAAYQNFNLDNLGSTTRFEQLCSALLAHYFGPNVIPFGALGPDGGIDALLNGLPQSYTAYNGIPLLHGTNYPKSKGYWVFQAKYHQVPYKNTTAKNDLEKEWKLWKGSKRKPKPDYFIFMTNVVFTPAMHKLFFAKIKKSKPFKYFNYWDGEKIAALIASNNAIRSSFFPNCEDANSEVMKAIKLVGSNLNAKANKKRKKKKTKKIVRPVIKKRKASYVSEVKDLVEYENAFDKLNSELLERFRTDLKDVPKSWESLKINAQKSGILTLSDESEHLLLTLSKASKSQSLFVTKWGKKLGEKVSRGESILEVAYDPADKELINKMRTQFFTINDDIDNKNSIDQKIKAVAQKAIVALRNSDSFEVEAKLKELLQLKTQYIETRSVVETEGEISITPFEADDYDWGFVRLWDTAFERICDVLITEEQPDDLYRTIASIPAVLAITGIDKKISPEEIVSDLRVINLLMLKAKEKNARNLSKILEYYLTTVYEHLNNQKWHIKSLAEAKWTFFASQTFADFAAELVKHSIDKRLDIKLDFAVELLETALGIDYSNDISIPQDIDWTNFYEGLGGIQKQNRILKAEMNFAIGTYAWFLVRKGKSELLPIAIKYIRLVSIKNVILLYSEKRQLRRWYQIWFHPEVKNFTTWWSKVDHDIREALLFKLALEKFEVSEVLDLQLLENEKAVSDFLSDLKEQYTLLASLSEVTLEPLQNKEQILTAAQKEVENKKLDSIRNNNQISDEKLAVINKSFSDFLGKHDPSGALYQVKLNTNEAAKPKYYVGTYMLLDKQWVIKDEGYSSYSVTTFGSDWAENILRGRESLLVKKLDEKVEFKKIKLSDLSAILTNIKETCGNEFVMMKNSLSIPWYLKREFVTTKDQQNDSSGPFLPGQTGRIGKVNVFSGRHLKRGQIVLFHKDTFTWLTKRVLEAPKIGLISEDSVEANAIRQKNPEIDLKLKVLVDAREHGDVEITENLIPSIVAWEIVVDKDEELY